MAWSSLARASARSRLAHATCRLDPSSFTGLALNPTVAIGMN
jgi:hypothetical protein